MKKYIILPIVLIIAGAFFLISFKSKERAKEDLNIYKNLSGGGNTDLVLPAGFHASLIENNIGEARHIAVTKEGDIYVKLLYPKNGKGILFLKKTVGNKYQVSGFGNYGGTGILLNGGYLYASSNTTVYRYKLNDNDEVTDPEHPDVIVKGLIDRRQHNSKSLAMDNNGNLYVNIGAYSNSCQVEDRVPGSMGQKGCPILDSAGGIWQFKADKLNQTYGDGVRYATGIRNVVGLDWNNQSNSLYVMQMGRDQLHDLFPKYYNAEISALLPAECLYELHRGANAGFPYAYYDQIKKKYMLAPEYGGNGKIESNKNYLPPSLAFPGHLAPTAVLFYTGNQFPEKYKNGAFIAFHGSWNRSPEKQAGFFVVFAPFENGKPTGKWEIFANNFAGTKDVISPRNAKYRPCGLAQGPDGSLYVSDDTKGAIFKISYNK
ncbi:MAG: PQQ-dependent sugar dehydrogenase [Chitinophagaceae bacterium]|nr:PQQ-dependent sugar dehydrogenase [Chitinophagaceae bacterium]